MMKQRLLFLKRNLLLGYILLSGVVLQAQTLAHSYTFEDGTANDTPGSGFTAVNGTLNGGSIIGGAYVASSNGHYISFSGSGLALNTYSTGITLEAYIKAGSTGGNNGTSWTYLASFGLNSTGLMMAATRYDGTSCTGFLGTGGATVTGPKIDDGNLHHIVSVLTSTTISLYIDGNLISSAVNTKAISSLDVSTAYLCKSLWSDPTWLGSIHEFNIYQGAMPATTVKSHATTFITAFNPTKTHSYTFESLLSGSNGVSGATIQDMVGSANGTINGAGWEVKNGAFCNHNSNQAAGSVMGGYVSFAGSAMGFSGYAGSLSYEAYITTTNDEDNPKKYSFIGYFGNASGVNSFFLRPEINGGGVAATYGNSTSVLTNAQGTTVMGAKETHHFVAVLKPSTSTTAGYIEIYMDGVLQRYTSLTANAFNTAVTGLGTVAAYLGKGGWSDPLNTNLIHEFNIYNGEMNATDVANRYAVMNTKLATLTINTGTLSPAFNANIYNYGLVLPAGTTSLTVNATPLSSNYSSVSGTTTYDVSAADYGTITLNVNAGSGTPYIINWRKEVSSPELTHSYPFNGNANDVIGTANGTLSPGAVGKIANGVFTTTAGTNFGSGTSQYISIPGSNLALNTYPSVTMEAIIKSSNSGYIASFGTQGLVYGSDYLNLRTTGSYISSYTYNTPWVGENTSTFADLTDGKPHHLVTLVDNDNIVTYVDGTLKTTTALSNVNKLYNLSNGIAYLCRSNYVSDANWVGSLGEYNIYKGKLNGATIASHASGFLKDATLSGITLTATPAATLSYTFDPLTTTYNINIPSGTTSVAVAATASKDFATMTGTGAISCNPGGATNIVVTSADGTTTKSYTLNFIPPTPVITVVQSSLSMDELSNTGTLTVTGANLTDVITIAGPPNFTFSPTTLPANSSAASVTVTYDGLAASSGNITLSSPGAASQTVSVVGASNTLCLSPLYTDRSNLVTEPCLNSLTAYSSSWGVGTGAFINTDLTKVYCGLKSGKVTGTRVGSITYPLNGKWTVNSGYHVRAKVMVDAGTFNFNVSGWSGASADIVNTYTTNPGVWQTVDFKFATGSALGANQWIYFNNYTSNAAGTGYVDNIEMYNIPMITVTAGTGGAISGAGPYDVNSPVSLVATPNTGYHFVSWTENGAEVSRNAVYTFSASSNRTLVASFAPNAVTVNSSTNASTLINCATCDVTVGNGVTLTVDAPVTLNSITIGSGGHVDASANTLTLSSLTIQSDATGTGTFVDKGTVARTATVQQYLTAGRNWYFASPVSNATSNVIKANASNSLWKYNENEIVPNWDAITATNVALDPMIGFVAKPATDGVITFTGILNNGAISRSNMTRGTTGAKRGFYLLGNPYPSYVNWVMATKTNLLPTMWLRTKNTSNTYVFDTYNATAQVGTRNNGVVPLTRWIAPMQSFWVRVNADNVTDGSLTFDNTMRTLQDDSLTTNKLRAAIAEEPQEVLRLQVSNGTNSDEAIVLFNPNAQDGYDAFDSPKMSNDNNAIPEIYTMAGSEPVVINGLSSVTNNSQFSLGFKTGQSDTFTIKVSEFSRFDPDAKVVLVDNETAAVQDLTDGSGYSFTSSGTNTTNRFSVMLKRASIATAITQATSGSILIYASQKDQITINVGGIVSEGTVIVTGVLGQLIFSDKLTGNMTTLHREFQPGVYVVKVKTTGKQVTQKIVIK